MRTLLPLLLLWLTPLAAGADSFYSTRLNGFAPYAQAEGAQVAGECLRSHNTGSTDYINIGDTQVSECTFSFSVRAANLNNEEGKKYPYTDSQTGKKMKTACTQWGVVWNYIDPDNYHAVLISCHNSDLYGLLDKRSMLISVVRVENGASSTLHETSLGDGVDLGRGFNLVKISYDGLTTAVAVGNQSLNIVAEIDGVDYSRAHRFGYLVGKGAKVDLERLVIRTQPILARALTTSWTKESLDERLASPDDPYEGYWTYLDRDLDENRMRLGGKYTVALIGNGDGYDIIYVEGAKVNGGQWQCGMLKGRLKRTIFPGNFDLVWYDALKIPFGDDEYANFEGTSLLTLHFPVYKSQIRLYKSPAQPARQ